MKTLLLAALMVLDSGATMKKHHHKHGEHHRSHGHHLDATHNSSASLAQSGHHSKVHSKDFYKHRNMLNEREHTNVQMYDTLNDKLTDEQFISQAIELN